MDLKDLNVLNACSFQQMTWLLEVIREGLLSPKTVIENGI